MTIRARIPVVIAGALAATTIAGVAAFASPLPGMATGGTAGGHQAHMVELDGQALTEMASMMDGADTIGGMHQEMAEAGKPLGQVHRDMHPQMGGQLGDMHRLMTRPTN